MDKELSFEDSMKRLEEIVQKMEDNDITLEESIKSFSRASKLVKTCEKKLAEFEKKVEMAVNDNGNVVWRDFQEQED